MRTLTSLVPWSLMALAACARRDSGGIDSTRHASHAPATDPVPQSRVVSPAGVGAIRVGQSIGAAAALPHPGAVLRAPHIECGYAPIRTLPPGVRIFVLNDVVARVDVDSVGVRTAEGIGVGDTEAKALSAYGDRAHVTPHKYTGPTGHYVTVVMPDDTLARIVFETDGTRVVSYRAGRLPAVGLVEGCG